MGSEPRQEPFEEPALLSPADIARTFNRGTRTIRNWTKAGYLTPVRIGRSIFYRAEDVRTLIIEGLPRG